MSDRNFLVIMSDEHTRSVMGEYGNSLAKTPTLDRLSREGVRFDNAYSPSPVCISARASFATGTPVFQHACWSSCEAYYGQQPSWMHRLRERGHEVVSIGKLHYRSAQDDCGFSESILPMYLANQGAGWVQGLVRKPMGNFPESAELAAELGPGETSYTRYDRDITAAAVDWLRAKRDHHGKPWVLFVSFISPHFPLVAPEPFYDLYRHVELPTAYDTDSSRQIRHPVLDEMRRFWDYNDHFDETAQREGLRNYYGLCSFLDDNLRQVLEALESSGQSANTQIVYTSDHGDLIGNHGLWGKCFMYEDSVGIPLTLSGAGIEPGVNQTPVSLIDLSATIEQSVCGEAVEAERDWQSRPLQDFIERPEPERPVISEYHDGGSPCGVTMLRRGPWKLICFAEGHAPLLFNMTDDPRELVNLAEDRDHREILQALENCLYSILDPEAVNRRAFSDQAAMIEKIGGIEKIRSMARFNHTPVESDGPRG